MDAVILVVAADDGVMPQTREHLDILTLLGVQHGIVALTKIDRVDAEELEIVREDLKDYLRGTFLENAVIADVSSVTGQGFDYFLEALQQMVKGIVPKRIDGLFRMPVDRAFSAKGYGTVIAGIPVSGAVHSGAEVVLLPQGQKGRAKNIQVYSHSGDTARAGECAALNVPQLDFKDIKRGDSLVCAESFQPKHWFLCEMRLLSHKNLGLKNAQQVKFHTGTSEVAATVYLLEGDRLSAGQQALVQIRMNQPIVAGPRDRFIIRTSGAVLTIGGGMIIEGIERRLKRSLATVRQDAAERAQAAKDDQQFIAYCIRKSDGGTAGSQSVSQRCKLPIEQVDKLIEQLCQRGEIVKTGTDHYIHRGTIEQIEQSILEALGQYHHQHPAGIGMGADELRGELQLDNKIFSMVVEKLLNNKSLRESTGRFSLPSLQADVPDEMRETLERVEAGFAQAYYSPPTLNDVSATTKLSADKTRKAVKMLTENGRLVMVSKDLYFHAEAVEQARQKLVDYIKLEGKLESVKFKYLLETSRKFAIPLLDHFDRIGVTRRVGYTRYLHKNQ